MTRVLLIILSFLSSISIAFANPMASPPEFLNRYVDANGDPKPVGEAHQRWLKRISLEQKTELEKGSKNKRLALITQAKGSANACSGFKEFDPLFSDKDLAECKKYMLAVSDFLIEALGKMTEVEVEDAYRISIARLTASSTGKELSPKEELDLIQSTTQFKDEMSKMDASTRAEMTKLIKLYDNPEFVKALELGDEKKLIEFFQQNKIDLPPGLIP